MKHRPEKMNILKSEDYSQDNSQDSPQDKEMSFKASKFKPFRFIFFIFLIMLFISQAIKWYSTSVTLPRFCEDPGLALHHLEEIISKPHPAGNTRETRRPYIIAAKLIYLVPQKSNESIENYLHRVRRELSQRCLR